MLTLLVASFIAGIITVAAPCILPLLPVIIGGSLVKDDDAPSQRQWLRPIYIALSLAVSVIVFTLLIKATTALLGVPQEVWQIVSGGLVILLGLYFIFPTMWARITNKSGAFGGSNKLLGKAYNTKGAGGPILIGAALGPVFSSCSPTYALIVAAVLPVSFAEGLFYLAAYAIGMAATLLAIAYIGQSFISKLKLFTNPGNTFKRTVGIVFVIVGLVVVLGFDKDIQAFVLEQGWYDPISNFEQKLL